MAIVDLVMPKLGESIMEATVLKWHKKPGDAVSQDETVLEIATDKVDSEVPSTAAGVLTEILFKENDVVPIGTVIARIETANGSVAATSSAGSAASASPGASRLDPADAAQVPYVPQPSASPSSFAPPSQVPSVKNSIDTRNPCIPPAPAPAAPSLSSAPDTSPNPR